MPSSREEKNEQLKTLAGLHLQGLSQYVDLPRVVLLGSSDSAKQTVIMALTGLPLPKEYLGNDFTMEFILTPSERTTIKMSIIPAYRGCMLTGEVGVIPALGDEIGCEDSDQEALFEFLLGRLILQLREYEREDLTIEDVIRVEIQRPYPGSMVILDLPQWPDRDASDQFVHQLTKSRNTILVAHDDISTLKSSKLSRLLEKRKSFLDGGNRTMAVFVARAAYLTIRDALQLRAVVQNRCRCHDFSFGWFILEDKEEKETCVQRPYTLDGFNFRCRHPETEDVRRLSQSLGFFSHVKSKLELDGILDVSKILGEIEMALHSGREKRMTAKKMRLLQEALRSLKKFDHQYTDPSPSSASSTAEIIYTPEESLSGDMEVHDASPRMLTPIPTRRGKGGGDRDTCNLAYHAYYQR